MKNISRYLLLFVVSIIIAFLTFFIFTNNARAAVTDYANDVWCQWENSGHIICTQGGDGLQGFIDDIGDVADSLSLTPNEIPIFGSDAQKSDFKKFIDGVAGAANTRCGRGRNQCHSYYYRPEASKNNGYPVFCNTDDFSGDADSIKGVNCLHMVFNNPIFVYGNGEPNRTTPGVANSNPQRIFPVGWEDTGDPLATPPNDECGITKTTNCVYHITGNTYNGPGLDTTGVQSRLQEQIDAYNVENDCESTISNPLSFILCPIRDALVEGFGKVIDFLTKLLENPKLSSNNSISDAVRSMITLANSFYIIIFLVIIFSNFIAIPKLDSYAIKKTLPKLIAAIILTQFSLLICQVILDLGNILASTLPAQLLSIFGISGTPGEAFANVVIPSAEGNFFQNLGQFIIMILALLVGLIVGLIAFFYLVARYLFMILLVLTLPLAFAAWVLPNTEQYFKKWWTLFVKLSLMYLLISLLFVGGAIFSKLLTSNQLFGTGISGFLSQLLALIVPLVVLMLVPKTLKVSGDIMAKAGKIAAESKAGQYGKEKVKKSSQEGKLAEAKGGAYEKFGQKLGGKRGARLEAKGAGLKAKGTENLKKDVSELSLARQLDLAKNSKNADVKKAAQKAIDAKRRELANTRSIDASQLGQQMLLKHNGNRAAAESELRAHLQRAGVAGASTAQLGADGRVTGEGLDLRATFENPEYPDYKPRGGAESSTPSTTTSSLQAPPSPPPGSGNSSSSSGSHSPSPSPSPTPSSSSSSPSARARAATPRPNPAGTSGPRVIPGTGGAVDLSDLGGNGTSTPPEPPPGTTE